MVVIINVSYQWRPPACLVCQVFGHDTASCKPSTLNSASQPLVSAETPAQTLEIPKPSEQTEQTEDQWQLVEKRKRTSPSRRLTSHNSIPSGMAPSSGMLDQRSSKVSIVQPVLPNPRVKSRTFSEEGGSSAEVFPTTTGSGTS